MSQKRTLTTGEVAKYCEVNLRTVLRWIENGHLKAYRLPGRGDNRIEVPAFVSFLKAHQMPIPPELARAGKKVLIVDDEATSLRTLEKLLKKQGFETALAPDGFSAGRLLESFNPQVLTLDLNMPGMDGFQVIRLVKTTESLKHIKILVVSGQSDEELERAKQAGADDYLKKPADAKSLLEKLEILTK